MTAARTPAAARPHRARRRPKPRPAARPRTVTAPIAPAAPTGPATGAFADLGLPAALVAPLAASGISQPTPIQAQAIPDALAGRDVLGRARTGSGKTLAFGLPLLARLAAVRDKRSLRPRAVVLLPTRELAQQVEAALRPLAGAAGLRMLVVVGGTSIGRQVEQLRRGVDVLVATPGRLLDLMDRNAVALHGVSIAVLDEADHMTDLGFYPAITRILDAMPQDRQCLLFSATLDRDVDKLVNRYLSRPAVHRVDDAEVPTAAMDHRVLRVEHSHKVDVAAQIAARDSRTLFFVRTKHGADRLARQFRNRGIEAGALHGNLNQNQRRRALAAFSDGSSRVLVATDVAARGIHVDDLDLVVHYDLPDDPKVYAHRSGRTARAGASGTVVSLVEPHQRRSIARIHEAADITARTASVSPGHPALEEFAS